MALIPNLKTGVVAGALASTPAFTLPAGAQQPCAVCHPNEVKGFAATQMGQSLGYVAQQPSGKYFHVPSRTQFTIQTTRTGMVQGMEHEGVASEYKVAYVLGSGAHAYAYIIQIGDHLFQSPLGYFPGRGWDMSPGYENSKGPDFLRPVTPECLVCHAGKVRPVAQTFDSYQDPPFEAEAITCERCHGPVEAHMRNPVPGSIVNPAMLPPRARDSVCEQCHLSGEERVPNPGKTLSDFRAGMNLEDVYSVYVSADSRDPSHSSALHVSGENFATDPAVLTRMGEALSTGGQTAEAASVFEQVIQLEPAVAVNYLHAGLAWEQAGDSQKAIAYFEKTLQLDPLMEQPYRELSRIFSKAHDGARVNETYERFLQAFQKTERGTHPAQ